MSRKPCTYTKQIWADRPNQIYIYIQKESGEVKGYFVTHQKQHIRTFSSLDAAQTFAKNIPEFKPKPLPSQFANIAQNFSDSPSSDEVSIYLLLELFLIHSSAKSEDKIKSIRRVISLVPVQIIPHTEVEFGQWLSKALESVGNHRTIRTVKSVSGFKRRVEELSKVVRVMKLFPIAFKKWLPRLPTLEARVKLFITTGSKEKSNLESYPPFTLNEIQNLLVKCATFPESACVVLALTSGLRSGEFEKVRAHHIIKNETLDLSRIITKTKAPKNPQASIALRLSAHYSQGEIPAVNNKRFRPTAAVNLIQSNFPILSISHRLGHVNTGMVIEHYAKQLPADWGAARTSEEYLGIGELKVGDWVCLENAWDKWCLRLLLVEAKRFGVLNEVKERLLGLVGERKVEVQRVDAF